MVTVIFAPGFQKSFAKIRHAELRKKITVQLHKIFSEPEIGKPMQYGRKGTREVYIPPFRLSYTYEKTIDTIYVLDLYHKDEQ